MGQLFAALPHKREHRHALFQINPTRIVPMITMLRPAFRRLPPVAAQSLRTRLQCARLATAPASFPAATPAAASSEAAAMPSSLSSSGAGKSDWYYAGWATLFSIVVGGPLFFVFELQNNLETRLWAKDAMPELLAQIDAVIGTNPSETAVREPLAKLPALPMLFDADSGDDGPIDDERWRFTSDSLQEAQLVPATGDREQGDEGKS